MTKKYKISRLLFNIFPMQETFKLSFIVHYCGMKLSYSFCSYGEETMYIEIATMINLACT